MPLALLLLVMFQGLLGMWTVTLLLKPLIVTAHLVFGLATLSLLWWLWLSMRRISTGPWSGTTARRGRRQHRGAAATGVSRCARSPIRPGGADLPDPARRLDQHQLRRRRMPRLPHCQAQWWPQTDFHDAFVLWRGLGINYEGGVLDHPARIAIHFAHRIGALVATITLLLAAITTLRGSIGARSAGLRGRAVRLWRCN